MNELSFKDVCRRFQLFVPGNWNEERPKELAAVGVITLMRLLPGRKGVILLYCLEVVATITGFCLRQFCT